MGSLLSRKKSNRLSKFVAARSFTQIKIKYSQNGQQNRLQQPRAHGQEAQEFDLSGGTVLTKLQEGNLYTVSFKQILKKFIYIEVFQQNMVAFEEQEAAKRSPDSDSKLFHATCDELDEIVTLKKEGAASEEVQGRLRRSGSRVC
ncbi:hypothetical protein CpipJ_CPIJ014486 [Culex quinquefasciatus]|uniref:Uncharacterized protein n=1 Tax=Culex quinquefasciatus TaxID=7176 RepID=B0X4Z4_CULQU|nr:hypothetical protein CpipJ_CPIJ014486 [Culex quinquefasciatus]|eukprot:XP_001864715.1 hypothetical protein CpipJ_CPIJ014486 [Culex quinquefasciatus]